MGIAERHYYRARRGEAPAGPRMRPRSWSFTTWLIVINVAVFVFTHVFVIGPNWPTYMGELRGPDVSSAEWNDGVLTRDVDSSLYSPLRGYALKVKDPQTGDQIGVKWYSTIMPFLQSWGHFSAGRLLRGQWDWVPEIWRLLTFQFLHASPIHLGLNMLGLYLFGPLVEQDLGRRRFIVFYLLCGAAGALLYLILVSLGNIATMAGIPAIPGLLFEDWYTPLIGASAGVFGILLACASIAPNEVVYLIFPPIPMRMKTFAWGFLLLSIVSLFIGTRNAGGEAAHIGGALAGWFLIRRRYLLRDVLRLLRLESGGGGWGGRPSGGAPSTAQVDRILAKAREHGLASLSPREKRLLHRASEGMRG